MPKRPPPQKVKPPTSQEVAEAMVNVMYKSLGGGLSPEEVMVRIRANGFHHTLLEMIHPEVDSLDGMAYGTALDKFEGELWGWIEKAAR